MQACNRQGLYCVPLYDSLGENAIEYILEHSESSAVFVETSKLGKLAAALPDVKVPVRIAASDPQQTPAAARCTLTPAPKCRLRYILHVACCSCAE